MANEFTRISHHVSGTTPADVNPSKASTGVIPGLLNLGAASSAPATYLPVGGYSNLSLTIVNNITVTVYWVYSDGTESASIGTLTANTWSDFTVPTGVICAKITMQYSSNDYFKVYYSLTN